MKFSIGERAFWVVLLVILVIGAVRMASRRVCFADCAAYTAWEKVRGSGVGIERRKAAKEFAEAVVAVAPKLSGFEKSRFAREAIQALAASGLAEKFPLLSSQLQEVAKRGEDETATQNAWWSAIAVQ